VVNDVRATTSEPIKNYRNLLEKENINKLGRGIIKGFPYKQSKKET